MRRVLPHAALLACLLAPAAAPAQTKIQPGASMEICTLNFVYDGLGPNAGKTYIGTAAHCVEKLGETVNDGAGDPIGTVAFIDDAATAATDFAFVEVLAPELGRVDPSVKGHPEYPGGYTVPEDTAPGDFVQISGFGVGFGQTEYTQENRQGVLQSDDEEVYAFSGPSVNGDSGGPLVHVDTGKALGIVSRYGFETASTDYGPTVQGVLAKAAAKGFPVRLRLAGQPPPAAEPPPAAPQPSPTPAPQPGPPPPAHPAEPAPPPSARAAKRRARLRKCRRAARRIKSPARRRKALKRCSRATR